MNDLIKALDFARQAREIDDLIQSTNWTTELVGF